MERKGMMGKRPYSFIDTAWEQASEYVKDKPYLCIVGELESGFPQVMTLEQRDRLAEIWDSCKPKLELDNSIKGKLIIYGTGGGVDIQSGNWNDLFKNGSV